MLRLTQEHTQKPRHIDRFIYRVVDEDAFVLLIVGRARLRLEPPTLYLQEADPRHEEEHDDPDHSVVLRRRGAPTPSLRGK
eukprot:1392753-Amorphochlora_amoeboformis.AAC.2